MTLRNRLTQLEKQQPATPQPLEDYRPHMAAYFDALARGEAWPAREIDHSADALRAEILQRLERLANAQTKHKITAA